MPDKLSRIRSQLNHVRDVREERAAEFWQQTILQGRMQQQVAGQQVAMVPDQKPQQPHL
jgi:hypothetical protein|nr:hypothetical protein [uncultured Rhodopila sp.]